MEKNQYAVSIMAVSIAIGILVGAMVALMIGNTTTAILGGVVSAGSTAWISSLQWSGARKFATDVADEINVRKHLQDIADLGGRIIIGTGKAVKWLLLAPIKLAIALATDVNARKTVLGTLIMLAIWIFSVKLAPFFVLLLPATIGVAVVILGSTLKNGPITLEEAKEEIQEGNLGWFYDFCFSWLNQLIIDDRGAIAAIARMLYIRTGNVLRILAYPFVLAIWGAVALANNKTGASALSAMILSGLHLAIAHLAGGIDMANANFWLSLAVAMGLGIALGRKVSAMRESATRRPLPSIKFRDQAEFHRS